MCVKNTDIALAAKNISAILTKYNYKKQKLMLLTVSVKCKKIPLSYTASCTAVTKGIFNVSLELFEKVFRFY